MLAPRFKPRPSDPGSVLCSLTFLTGIGHFHGSKWSGPIQVASTQGDHFEMVASKLSGTQSRLALSLYALKEFCRPSAWLTCSRNRARLWFLSAAPGVPKRVTHPSTVLAQCCLTSVFKWELVFPTWQRPLATMNVSLCISLCKCICATM